MARVPLSKQNMPRNMKDLEAFYRKLAKQADIKMKAIEASDIPHAKDYAYRVAAADIARLTPVKETRRALELSGKGSKILQKPRWERTTKGMNYQTLAAKTRAVQKFLNAPTSTEKGIKEGYQQRVDKINSKFGTDFTPSQLKAFFRSQFWKKMIASGYDSGETLEIIGTLQDHNINTKEKLTALVEKANKEDITIRNEKFDSEIHQEAIEESVLDMLRKETAFDVDKIGFDVVDELNKIIGRI